MMPILPRPVISLSSLYMVLALCLSIVMVSGCGIKPDRLDAPKGAEDRVFPRTYPDIRYDPPAPVKGDDVN